MASCLSPVSLYGSYLSRTFKSAGLRRRSITIDGEETTLYFWVSTITTPPKPTVVLIHGFGPEPTWQWSHQIKPLSRQFRLVVPDLVFFGESTTKSASRSEIFQAKCIVKLLNQIGVDKFYPVGTSYGGFVAYHVGRICGPGRVEKVVIVSSNVLMKEGDNRELMENIVGVKDIEELMLPKTPAMMRTLVKLVMFRPPRWSPDFLLKDLIQTLYADNREEKVQLIKNITLEKSDGLQQLPQEVLLVWGEHDNLFPLEKAWQIKKKIGKKVVLQVIKNTSHLPQSENPKRFNAVVKDFLLGNVKSSL